MARTFEFPDFMLEQFQLLGHAGQEEHLRSVATQRVLELVVRFRALQPQLVEEYLDPGRARGGRVYLLGVSLGEDELGAEVGEVGGRVQGIDQESSAAGQHAPLDGVQLLLLDTDLCSGHHPRCLCLHNTLFALQSENLLTPLAFNFWYTSHAHSHIPTTPIPDEM